VREAKAAARVDHPAIVHVHDVGWTADGDPFLVMELLEGEPLGNVITRERRLGSITAMQIILPVAGALAAMHAKGILHRDVKPDNIFLAQDDTGRWQPKLIDFGLARLEAKPLTPITQRGMVVGTPVYLAPERIWGEEADPRDDVWSLAVALYEMVTGKVPFEGDHPAQILLAVRAGEPASFASHGVDDPELWEIVKRGLARRRHRWASVRELGESIAHLLWKRGVAQDISGISLWPSWIDELRPRPSAPPSTPATLDALLPPPSPEAASHITVEHEVLLSSAPPAPARLSARESLSASEPAASERGRFRRPESLPSLPRTTASFGLLPPTLSTPTPRCACPSSAHP
jgi:serine/threonine-protein kinase